MADYTLSAKGTYDGSSFDKGIAASQDALSSFQSSAEVGGKKLSAATIAMGNVMADVFSKAMGVVQSSIGDAVARVDTLNQFPKMMQNLGYSADDARVSVNKLADGIEGLPTSLDQIVANTQQLALSLGSLDKATDVALALNDGFITFGASSENVTGAITQLNQMITAGKYDMQSWNSINQAAPGYLDTVARSMLGASAKASDLREALNNGTITGEQFLSQMIKLDKEGSAGIVAFSQSAKTASGGIATSMANARTAVVKNVANIIDSINGSDGNLVAAFDAAKAAVNQLGAQLKPLAQIAGNSVGPALKAFNDSLQKGESVATAAAKALGKLPAPLRDISVLIAALAAKALFGKIGSNFMGMAKSVTDAASGVVKGFGSIKGEAKAIKEAFALVKGGAGSAADGLNLLKTTAPNASAALRTLKTALSGLGIMAAVAAVAALVMGIQDLIDKQQKLDAATNGLRSATDGVKASLEGLDGAAETTSQKMANLHARAQEVTESQAAYAEKVRETWDEMSVKLGTAQRYADILADLSDKGRLSSAEQVKLKAAVDGFNEATGNSVEIVDAVTGKLSVEKDALYSLVDAYAAEARAAAARELYQQGMQQEVQTYQELMQASRDYAAAEAKYEELFNTNAAAAGAYLDSTLRPMQKDLQNLTDEYYAVRDSNAEMLNYMALAEEGTSRLSLALSACGVSMSDFGDLSQEQLSALEAGFNGKLTDIVAVCQEKGIQIPQTLATAIGVNSGLPVDQQNLMLDYMALSLTNNDVEAAAELLGRDIDAGLKSGIESGMDLPAAAATSMSEETIEAAKSALESHSPSQVFVRIGEDIDAGLSQGIEGSASQPTSAMNGVTQSVQNAANGLPNWAKGIGTSAGSLLASGLSSNRGAATTAGSGLNSSAQSGISGVKSAFGSIGSTAGSNFASAIGRSSAYSQGASLAGTARNGLGSVSASSAGYNFVSGFASGMYGVNLFSTAWSIGMSALSGIKSALGIASPSKEAMKVGEFFGEGAVIGMKKTEGALEAESRRMSDAMSLQPYVGKYSLQPYQAAMQGGLQMQRQVSLDVEINVNMADGREAASVGRSLANELYSELARLERSSL